MNRYWRQMAACRGVDPELFVTPPHQLPATMDHRRVMDRARAAFRLCGGCPVRVECHTDAERTGVVGMIRAGVAYDRLGDVVAPCSECRLPMVARNGVLAATCSKRCATVRFRRRKAERVAS